MTNIRLVLGLLVLSLLALCEASAAGLSNEKIFKLLVTHREKSAASWITEKHKNSVLLISLANDLLPDVEIYECRPTTSGMENAGFKFAITRDGQVFVLTDSWSSISKLINCCPLPRFSAENAQNVTMFLTDLAAPMNERFRLLTAPADFAQRERIIDKSQYSVGDVPSIRLYNDNSVIHATLLAEAGDGFQVFIIEITARSVKYIPIIEVNGVFQPVSPNS